MPAAAATEAAEPTQDRHQRRDHRRARSDIHFDVGDDQGDRRPAEGDAARTRARSTHTFTIKDTDFELKAKAGETETGTVTLQKGTYTFECTIAGHAAAGYEGHDRSLVTRAGVPAPDSSPAPLAAATVGAYVRLTKPRVIELLLVTAVPPMILAEQGLPVAGSRSLAVVVGGALAAGGANTINCWIERDRDQLMRRTARPAAPAGRDRAVARARVRHRARTSLAFVLLASAANLLAAVLTLSATLFYVFVYTLWLKPRTVQNIVIGGAAGAVPALVGWAAVRDEPRPHPRGSCSRVVFFWTPAHFWALAMKYRDDYAAAGIPMLPVVRGIEETTRQIAAYAMITVALTFALTLTGDVGRVYAVSVLVLGVLFVVRALALRARADTAAAIRFFAWSNVYLMLVFVAVAVDALVH